MYRTEVKLKKIPMEELKKNYCDRDKFEKFCKECRNYGSTWSCPPYDFSVEEYLEEYKYMYLAGIKIIFDEETLKEINTKDKINNYTTETLKYMKDKIMKELLRIEKIYTGSKSLSAGGCKLCDDCSRKNNIQCQHPDMMRYSLESMGFDVGGISSKLLNYELKWATETSLPEYFSLVTGLMTITEIEGFEKEFMI
ncbi:MAG: DUF2284 domain-containing protein [Fusobacterium varium]|uniref:DUF2284 domain-containing protein n=1 Tax=Fusobacterium varium TaxID=856 RepID=UPI0024323AFC|nr:DUF2284 domain-containing protein [Fusobacterium varium]UYI80177.1 MAG: DUF2284 domain-containing protein [Fusobacterium varium]